jgi:hypothetical protein
MFSLSLSLLPSLPPSPFLSLSLPLPFSLPPPRLFPCLSLSLSLLRVRAAHTHTSMYIYVNDTFVKSWFIWNKAVVKAILCKNQISVYASNKWQLNRWIAVS